MSEPIQWALNPTDSATFTGSAYSGLLGAAEEEVGLKIYYVRFLPGSRTFWHSHAGPQILIVRSGKCRYQREGEPIREASQGVSIRFEAGERHWHGATDSSPTEHIAVNLSTEQTIWLGEVSEAQYSGHE